MSSFSGPPIVDQDWMQGDKESTLKVLAPRDLFNLPLHDGPFLVDCRAKDQYDASRIASSVCYLAVVDEFAEKFASSATEFWQWVNDNAPVDNYKQVILIFEDNASEHLARELADRLLACEDMSGGRYRNPLRATSARLVQFAPFATIYPFYLNVALEDLPTYPTEVYSNLYLSGAEPARKQAMFEHLGITHTVNCASFKEPNHFEGMGITYLRLNIVDDEGQNLDKAFQAALPFIASARAGEGNKVLIHCNQGKNRSVAVLVAHLISAEGEFTATLDEALDYVRAVRSLPNVLSNENFVQQLQTRQFSQAPTSGAATAASGGGSGSGSDSDKNAYNKM
jgi:protein-tyrosine phosphatase